MDDNWFDPTQRPVSIHVRFQRTPGRYTLRVYNSAGELVKVLTDERVESPRDQWLGWDGTNHAGEDAASGVYLLHLTAPFQVEVRKILLLR